MTFAAFADGELSVDQVVTVAQYTPAHNDAEVCEFARSATVNQLRHALSKYVHVIEPIAASPTEAKLSGGDVRNQLVRFVDEDSRYHLHVNAPADQGEIISKAIREARDALFLGRSQGRDVVGGVRRGLQPLTGHDRQPVASRPIPHLPASQHR